MQTIVIIFHLFLSIALIGLILIQRGKGAEAGAAFGSGASQTVFGSQGSASFLTRTTAVLATLFFISSLTLAYFTTQGTQRKSVTEVVVPPQVETPQAQQSKPDVPALPAEEPASPAPDDEAGQ